MWGKVKTVLRWIYDWITVIVASLVGAPALVLQLLNAFSGIDISPFIGADKALKIVTIVAIAKAILATIESNMTNQRPPDPPFVPKV